MDYNKEKLQDFFEEMFHMPINRASIYEPREYPYFMLLWMYYNSYYSDDTVFPKNKNKGDKQAAISEGNFNFSDKAFLSDIIRDFSYILSNRLDAMSNNKRIGVVDMRSHEVITRRPEDSDLVYILRMIYQLRCNLFHGSKLRYPEDHDNSLVNWAFSALRKLMLNSTNVVVVP